MPLRMEPKRQPGVTPLSQIKELALPQTPIIAVVDDDPGMCEALAELLEVSGYVSVQYHGGHAFLVDLGHRDFDCLVTDISMPGLDGFELGRIVSERAPRLPIIFVSSLDGEIIRRKALNVGQFYFSKPIDADEFLDTITGLTRPQ